MLVVGGTGVAVVVGLPARGAAVGEAGWLLYAEPCPLLSARGCVASGEGGALSGPSPLLARMGSSSEVPGAVGVAPAAPLLRSGGSRSEAVPGLRMDDALNWRAMYGCCGWPGGALRAGPCCCSPLPPGACSLLARRPTLGARRCPSAPPPPPLLLAPPAPWPLPFICACRLRRVLGLAGRCRPGLGPPGAATGEGGPALEGALLRGVAASRSARVRWQGRWGWGGGGVGLGRVIITQAEAGAVGLGRATQVVLTRARA